MISSLLHFISYFSLLEGGHARAADVPAHPADARRHRPLQVPPDGRRQLLRPAGRLEGGDRRDAPRDQGEGEGKAGYELEVL